MLTSIGKWKIRAIESGDFRLDGGAVTILAGWECNFGNGYFGTTAVASTNADAAGIGSFEYAVPASHYALCTKNMKAYG